MIEIIEQFLKTDDGRIHYKSAGRGKDVVLIHGMGGSCDSWNGIFLELTQTYRVHALCVLGLGDSDKPVRFYRFEEYGEAIVRFMDAAGIGRASLVGHSMGGLLAVVICNSHANRVDKIVLEGCPAWTAAERLKYIESLDKVTRADGSSRPYNLEDLKQSYFSPDLKILDNFNADRRKAGTCFKSLALATADFDARKAIGNILVPTLIIVGEAEKYPGTEPQFFLKSIPGSRLATISRSAHNPHQENPSSFLAALLSFLDEY